MCPGLIQVELWWCGEIADQQRGAGFGAAHRGRRPGNSGGECLQCGIDLAEFDAPPTQLDLIIGAP